MNDCTFEDKIKRFQEGGPSLVVIVSDFDGTMTKGFKKTGVFAPNSMSVFRKEGFLSDEYVKITEELAKTYYPIESDAHISKEDRSKAMVQWWSKHFEAMRNYGLSKSVIESVVKSEKIPVREDMSIYFSYLREKGIPLVVFSAGLGDVIELILLKNGGFPDDTFLVSNFAQFDNEGKFVGLKSKHFIHSLNKSVEKVDDFPFHKEIEGRKNVIVMGDSQSDVDMIEGLDCENVIRIGFFKDKGNKDLEQVFIEKFDIVFEDDVSFDPIIGLLIRLFGEA